MFSLRHLSYNVRKGPQYKAILINVPSVQFYENYSSAGVYLHLQQFCFFPLNCLRHYTTSRKVAGSSPDAVDLNLPNPSSYTMALWPTWPLTEMSIRNLPEGEVAVNGGRLVRLRALPLPVSRLYRQNVGASMSHNPMGLHGLLQG
jgi:hypothetical protein